MEEYKIKIINNQTKNGQTKCPECGASDVFYDEKKQKLVCHYCHHEFEKKLVDGKEAANTIEGDIRGSATKDINKSADDLVTIQCEGCGAEIVLNTKETLHAKCHWCGSSLSINHQIDNGMIPDEILPFRLTREQALDNIFQYVRKKLDFTTKDFKNGLTLENVRGVFFSYLIFDTKAHGKYSGLGEHTTRTYTFDDDTYHDADVYHVEREFDLVVDDLTIESNLNRLDKFNTKQKNNVINAVMPFDTQNCIQFNANYMQDYTSEKRDVDISVIEGKVHSEVNDIAKNRIVASLKHYDRGVHWEEENIDFTGKQWLTAYLPVWLYSYQDKKGVLHYVAVNGRTGETVGSIPLDKEKLYTIMLLMGIPCFIFGLLFLIIFFPIGILLLLGGLFAPLILFVVEDYKYGNLVWKRHHYEIETKCDLKITNSVDNKIDERHRTRTSSIENPNHKKVHGDFIKIKQNTK